jgi:hypothetical protein
MTLQQPKTHGNSGEEATANDQMKQNARPQSQVQKANVPLRELQDYFMPGGGQQWTNFPFPNIPAGADVISPSYSSSSSRTAVELASGF